jgi:hypothetical protein
VRRCEIEGSIASWVKQKKVSGRLCVHQELAMSTTLPLFWQLSSASPKDRIDASVKLIGALEQFQAQFIPNDSARTSDEADIARKTDSLDALNAQDVSYSIRRLIRGLASPRECSRLGFAVALTEVSFGQDLREHPLIIALHSCCPE